MRTLTIIALLTLALAANASAGGFSTVGIDQMPASAAPGSTWSPQITVRGHGVRPADGLKPVVLLTSAGREERFVARPTGRPGVYRADVTFPATGRWSVTVDDGWGMGGHAFGAIDVPGSPTAAAPGGSGDGGGSPLLPALLAGLAAAALTAALQRARPRRATAATG